MPDYATQHSGPRGARSPSSGVDAGTLFLTAAASAAAAYTCSKIWAPGTLASAAFTPVLVALIKEALRKPTQVVARAVPVRGVVRSARAEGPQPLDVGRSATSAPDDWGAPASHPSAGDYASPEARIAQPGEVHYHGSSRRGRGWRLAIVTGLLGFLVCAAVFTVPELISGGSAAGGDRVTTIFGGRHHSRLPPATTTTTTTPTQTVTAPPAQTVTVPAPAPTPTTPTTTTTEPQPLLPTTTEPTATTPPPAETQPPVVPPPG
jgi:hypothetical protein